jgi:peptidoglycan/LPS O-acetylase OafA/YrhL
VGDDVVPALTGRHRLVEPSIGDYFPNHHTVQGVTVNFREPALLWVGLVAPIVSALAAFVFAADPTTQGIVNTAAVAVAGGITAWLVSSDNLVPALLAAAQAVIALIVAFGADWTSQQQAALMVPLGVVVSILVRDRVTAPVPAVVAA